MSDTCLEFVCNNSKIDSRNIDMNKDMEKEIQTTEYILEKQLSDNETTKNKEKHQTRNECRTKRINELYPITPSEFLNNIPSYLVSDLSKNKSSNMMCKSLSFSTLNKMEESKKLLSELSAFDEGLLNQCKTLRNIAKGLRPIENFKQVGRKCTSDTYTAGTLRRNVNCHAISSATEGQLPRGNLNGDYNRWYTTGSSNFLSRNSDEESDVEEYNEKLSEDCQQAVVDRFITRTNIDMQQQSAVESAGDYDATEITRASGSLQSKGYDDGGDNGRYVTRSSLNPNQDFEEETYDEEGHYYSSYAGEYDKSTHTDDRHHKLRTKRDCPVNAVTETMPRHDSVPGNMSLLSQRFFGSDRLSFSQSSIEEEEILSCNEFIVYDDDDDHVNNDDDDYYSQEYDYSRYDNYT